MRKTCSTPLDLMEAPPESLGVIVVPFVLRFVHCEDGAGETDEVAAEAVELPMLLLAVLLLPLDPDVVHAVG